MDGVEHVFVYSNWVKPQVQVAARSFLFHHIGLRETLMKVMDIAHRHGNNIHTFYVAICVKAQCSLCCCNALHQAELQVLTLGLEPYIDCLTDLWKSQHTMFEK